MRISKKSEYAVRAVFELALRENYKPMKGYEIAAGQVIPERYLATILVDLRRAGYLCSNRGRDGGYYLARPAGKLTVGDVIRATQGAVFEQAQEQMAGWSGRYVTGDYAFEDFWRNVGCAVSEVVHTTSFAELVEYEKARRSTSVRDYSI